jgi:hypothetical protein
MLTIMFMLTPSILANELVSYEKDGRVSPITQPEKLSEGELNIILKEIGLNNEIISNLPRNDKEAIAAKGGKVADLEIKNAKRYYVTLDGEKIEYTEENLNKIVEQKEKDVKEYNTLTGESLTVSDLGGNHLLRIGERQGITPMRSLPNYGYNMVINGKLELVQQVIYLGSTSTQYRYLVVSNAAWNGSPLNTKQDVMASAWDVEGVATANTFAANWFQQKEVADGKGGTTWINESKQLQADPDSNKAYGHGVKFTLGEGDFQNIHMEREIRVSKNYTGHPAYIQTKYFHKYGSIGSVGINIGPASVSFSGANLGDVTLVEYSYDYGDM